MASLLSFGWRVAKAKSQRRARFAALSECGNNRSLPDSDHEDADSSEASLSDYFSSSETTTSSESDNEPDHQSIPSTSDQSCEEQLRRIKTPDDQRRRQVSRQPTLPKKRMTPYDRVPYYVSSSYQVVPRAQLALER